MSIPIRNLYYLLCYAWDTLDRLDVVDAGRLDAHDSASLLARVLGEGVRDLLRRGLDREYVEVSEDVSGIRGRIDFGTTTRRLLLPLAKTHCRYDELSHDVLHSRIVRETIRILSETSAVSDDHRHELRSLFDRLWDVSPIRVRAEHFGRVRIHRNNSTYRHLLDVCRLVHDSVLVDEDGEVIQFSDFSRSERMSTVFETFVRRFLQRHAPPGHSVGSRRIAWQDTTGTPEALARIPQLVTDVVVQSPATTLVIETKYYERPLLGNPRFPASPPTFAPHNVNQLFAYLRNFSKLRASQNVEGLLLYAATDATPELRDELVIHGHKVRVATLDLFKEWQEVHAQLLSLVGW